MDKAIESLYELEKVMTQEEAYSSFLKIVNTDTHTITKNSISGRAIKELINIIGTDIKIIKDFYAQYMNAETNDHVLSDDICYYLIRSNDKILLRRDKIKSPKKG